MSSETDSASGPARAWLGWVSAGLCVGAAVGWRAAWTNPSLHGMGNAIRAESYGALCYAVLGAALGVVAVLEVKAVCALFRRDGVGSFRFGPHTLAAAATFAGFCLGNYVMAGSSAWGTEVDRRSVLAGIGAALFVQLAASAVLGRGSRPGTGSFSTWWGRATLAGLVLIPLATVLGGAPAHRDPGDEEPPTALTETEGIERLVLLGIDGADWNHVQPLLDAGQLPNLQRLIDAGTRAPLRTLTPTWSPCIWTTIVTGQLPEVHGVLDFTEIPVPGFRLGVQRLRVVERLAQGSGVDAVPMPAHVGITPIVYGLVDAGILREEPIRAYHRRVKALWNVLSDQGRSVAVVRWWASWPAEAVQGALVSENASPKHAREILAALGELKPGGAVPELPLDPTLTHPPNLLVQLATDAEEQLADPAGTWRADGDEEARRVVESLPFFADLDPDQREALVADFALPRLVLNTSEQDRFAISAARTVLEAYDPELLAVYLQGVDAIAHRLEPHAKRDPAFLSVVARYWERVDQLIGELATDLGDDATWLIVSDHGWSYDRERYGHYHAPDGIFLLSGPGARAGHALETGASPHVIDMAPTILALLGLPASDEMPGAPVERALNPALVDRLPRERVATYGAHRPVWSAEAASGSDGTRAEMLDTLRELGYVQ